MGFRLVQEYFSFPEKFMFFELGPLDLSAVEGDFDLLLQLDHATTVRQLTPNLPLLAQLPVRGVIVTALGDAADHDFISRFFAPASGVPEDPVTGSAHCALAPFWQPHFGRSTLFGFQASQRGGHVRMDVHEQRVRLTGNAVTVFRGTLFV